MNNTDELIVPILQDIQNITGGEIKEVGDIKYLFISNSKICVEIRQRSKSNQYNDDGIWSIWLWLKNYLGPDYIVPLNNPNAIKIIAEAIKKGN